MSELAAEFARRVCTPCWFGYGEGEPHACASPEACPCPACVTTPGE